MMHKLIRKGGGTEEIIEKEDPKPRNKNRKTDPKRVPEDYDFANK